MAEYYDRGDMVRLTASFTVGGTPTDPTAVVCRIRTPNTSTSTTATVVKDGVGLYHADFTTTVSGNHYYRFEGTGSAVGAEEKAFIVRRSGVLGG